MKYVLVRNKKDMIKLIKAGVLKHSYGYLDKITANLLFELGFTHDEYLEKTNEFPTIFQISKETIEHQPNERGEWSLDCYNKWITKCISTKKYLKKIKKENNETTSNN